LKGKGNQTLIFWGHLFSELNLKTEGSHRSRKSSEKADKDNQMHTTFFA